MLDTLPLLKNTTFPSINRKKLELLQINLGYICNQQCLHCHVNAGPKRKEIMALETIKQILEFLKYSSIKTLDLTGGAPELNPHFEYIVTETRKMGIDVIDRCNLTILMEEDKQNLANFLAENQVKIVASLPCYIEDNVDKQRGKGVYNASIQGLKKLNNLGYGMDSSNLELNLVFNPQGTSLPPPQKELEVDYKDKLSKLGIYFNQLFTITNMPIKRFGSTLLSLGKFDNYMELLKNSYKHENLDQVMCRSLLSIDWQGFTYDCDFNQMLDLYFNHPTKTHIKDLIDENFENVPIEVAGHCYGCTAGQGSSCGGSLD
ncbi:MAG: radical SAM/Cys-rich domain protein [Methylococcales bacterium]|jgi:radical SAM/Cys-rich protein|nr:radical SAM/Cys-rich domain protein [Methylococcales bacterium]